MWGTYHENNGCVETDDEVTEKTWDCFPRMEGVGPVCKKPGFLSCLSILNKLLRDCVQVPLMLVELDT